MLMLQGGMTVYKCGNARTNACAYAMPAVKMQRPENAVQAGKACETPCAAPDVGGSALPMAQLMFPIQEYTYGFCPSDALCHGTMFPELVR